MNKYLHYIQDNEEIQFPFFEFLNEKEIDRIRKKSNVVIYHKRDTIFLQNTRTSHIMCVKSGLIKIYKEGRMGKTIILKLATNNDFIGLMSVFGNDIHEFSAAAVEESEICYIDINIFREILQQNGKLGLYIINIMSRDGLYLFDRLISQVQKQLPGRIADVLLYFSEEVYKNQKFSFPLTRRELAELAGTTKESFIRTLTEFKNDKIIELNGPDVQIISMKIVQTLSKLG